MVDYLQSIQSAISAIDSGAQYELFCDSSTGLPRITYMENSNIEELQGDTLGYSYISFIIKVWDNSISHAQEWACDVDNAMRALGFKRTASNELLFNNNICKVLTYGALFHEDYESSEGPLDDDESDII